MTSTHPTRFGFETRMMAMVRQPGNLPDADLELRIIPFIGARAGLPPSTMTSASTLLHDLKIDGDDAEELLTEYSDSFQVDMTGFHFREHFRP